MLIKSLAGYAISMGQGSAWVHPQSRLASPTIPPGKARPDRKKKRRAQRAARRLNR